MVGAEGVEVECDGEEERVVVAGDARGDSKGAEGNDSFSLRSTRTNLNIIPYQRLQRVEG
jgi:hypothetical protein